MTASGGNRYFLGRIRAEYIYADEKQTILRRFLTKLGALNPKFPLFLAEHLHRVDARGAERGKQTREERDDEDNKNDRKQSGAICGRYAIEQARKKA